MTFFERILDKALPLVLILAMWLMVVLLVVHFVWMSIPAPAPKP